MKFSRFGFGSGIMSGDMAGRFDVDKYQRGCEVLRNFELLQSGAVRRRCGSKWLCDLGGERPNGLGVFVWSDGSSHLLCVVGGRFMVMGLDGEVVYERGYDAKGQRVRFMQVNDLVFVLNGGNVPYKLSNVGGVFSLDEVAWKGYPLEGNFEKDFGIWLSEVEGRVLGGWDGYEKSPDVDYGDEVVELDKEVYRYAFPRKYEDGKSYTKKVVTGYGNKLVVTEEGYWQKVPIYGTKKFVCDVEWQNAFGLYLWRVKQGGEYVGVVNNLFEPVRVKAGQVVRLSGEFECGYWLDFYFSNDGEWPLEVASSNEYPAEASVKDLAGGKFTYEYEVVEDGWVRVGFKMHGRNEEWGGSWAMEVFRYGTGVVPGEVIRGEKQGETFAVGDVIGVKHLVEQRKWKSEVPVASEVNLAENSYDKGAVVKSTDVVELGAVVYWTCIRDWVADAEVMYATNPDMHPDYFERGLEFGRTWVAGAWEFGGKATDSWEYYALQTSSDGVRWETMQGQDGRIVGDTDIVYTGDNDGDALLMRAVLLSHSKGRDTSALTKQYFTRKAANVVHYLRILDMDEDGKFGVKVLNMPEVWEGSGVFGSWDFYACREANGYPTSCVLHEGRLVFGGVKRQPSTLWFSAVDDLYNFRVGDGDADSMLLTMSSTQRSELVWLASSGSSLLCGTSTGEVVINSVKNAVLSSSTAVAQNHSNCGSHVDGDALLSTDAVLFVDRSGKRLRRMSYSTESDFYYATDMTVFAYGVLSGGVSCMAWQRAPEPVAWVVPAEGEYKGSLMGMLYNPQQELYAWFEWNLGGDVVSVATTATGQGVDELYVVVDRGGEFSLEVLDRKARDYDRAGQSACSFTAHLRSTSMDSVEYFGEYGRAPKVHLLLDGVDAGHTKVGVGAELVPMGVGAEGDGWVRAVAPSRAGTKRVLEVVLEKGHGAILCGAVSD